MRPCPKCGQGAPAGARFCPACGSALEDAAPAQQELRKVVTVVFCDLSGSTGLGERLDPESVRGVVTRFFDATKAALEHHGGTVEKFIGDAVMAVFGVPVVHEDDALRAVRAVDEMRTALEQLNEQLDQRYGVRLRVRTGVNTGEVIAGDPSAGHGFVTGDAVNVAARLEQAAGDGEVLLGEATAELVRDAVDTEPAGELELRGRGRPVRAFRLAGVRERGGDPGRLAPLVGRERELALLREALERSGDRCELVTLLGAAGLGKSRLVAELESSLDGTATVVTGRCLSYGEGLTFWPVREVVEALAGIDDADSLDEAQAALERLLSRDDERDTIVARLAGAVGLTAEPASPAEIAWAVRRVVESAAAERGPLVVVFEDAHWGEGTFLDLVEYLARTVEGPVLLLLVAREDVLEKRPALAGARVELAPLSEAESRELVGHLAGEGVSPRSPRGRSAPARATRCSWRSWSACWPSAPASRCRRPSTRCWRRASRSSTPTSARWPRRRRWWAARSARRRRSASWRASSPSGWPRGCGGWRAGAWSRPTAGASPASPRSASGTS